MIDPQRQLICVIRYTCTCPYCINLKGSITKKRFFPESYPEYPILT